MRIPKKYIHDRFVVLLLSANGFLAILNSILILFRLDSGGSDVYIVQYRANLGLSAFKRGGAEPLISFVIFGFLIFIIHVVLSIRVYNIKRNMSVTVLVLGTLLLSLAIIVSNALLRLR